jgi:hypothetical protein
MNRIVKAIKNPRKAVSYVLNKANLTKVRSKTVVTKVPPKKVASTKIPAKKPAVKTGPLQLQLQFLGKLGSVAVNPKFDASIAVYFDGKMNQIYQINVWIACFKNLDLKHPIVILVRDPSVFKHLVDTTDFSVVLAVTINNVTKFYENNNFKCILYVNHAARNFQSLIQNKAFHIHINHGESDKLSTITNQAKAYDLVFITGPAAFNRYKYNLIRKDMKRFVQIGRPQLEHVESIESIDFDNSATLSNIVTVDSEATEKELQIEQNDTITVLYAPTWEGTHDSMNYQSIDWIGKEITEILLAHPRVRLIYKPHPNTGSRKESVKKVNQSIIKMVKESSNAVYINNGDILSVFAFVDIALFDNSTVSIDYLTTDKPMLITNTFDLINSRMDKPLILSAAKMIGSADVKSIISILFEENEKDTYRLKRKKARSHYLGKFDYKNGESTSAFISAIENAMDERDKLVEDLETELSD